MAGPGLHGRAQQAQRLRAQLGGSATARGARHSGQQRAQLAQHEVTGGRLALGRPAHHLLELVPEAEGAGAPMHDARRVHGQGSRGEGS